MSEPVTEAELANAILEAISKKFKGRTLSIHVCRRAFSQAMFDLNMLELTAQVDEALKKSK